MNLDIIIESKDRPSSIDFSSHNDKISYVKLLKFSCPNVATMFGDKIDVNDSHWKTFLIMLKITDYMFSPVVTQEDCSLLKVDV